MCVNERSAKNEGGKTHFTWVMCLKSVGEPISIGLLASSSPTKLFIALEIPLINDFVMEPYPDIRVAGFGTAGACPLNPPSLLAAASSPRDDVGSLKL